MVTINVLPSDAFDITLISVCALVFRLQRSQVCRESVQHLTSMLTEFSVVHRQSRWLDRSREIFPSLQNWLYIVVQNSSSHALFEL